MLTFIFTYREMEANSFGVVWTVLFVLLGQNILELICFGFVCFFGFNLFREYANATPL